MSAMGLRMGLRWKEQGQGVVEYALILAFVVMLGVVALSYNDSIGEGLSKIYESVAGLFAESA